MTAQTYELIINPWVYCRGCGDQVRARSNGHNLPCGCAAPAPSICPTWDEFDGCQCSNRSMAELFQAALEQAQAQQLAEQNLWPHPAPEHDNVPVVEHPEVERLIATSRAARPGRAVAIVALIAFLAVVFLVAQQLGLGG